MKKIMQVLCMVLLQITLISASRILPSEKIAPSNDLGVSKGQILKIPTVIHTFEGFDEISGNALQLLSITINTPLFPRKDVDLQLIQYKRDSKIYCSLSELGSKIRMYYTRIVICFLQKFDRLNLTEAEWKIKESKWNSQYLRIYIQTNTEERLFIGDKKERYIAVDDIDTLHVKGVLQLRHGIFL